MKGGTPPGPSEQSNQSTLCVMCAAPLPNSRTRRRGTDGFATDIVSSPPSSKGMDWDRQTHTFGHIDTANGTQTCVFISKNHLFTQRSPTSTKQNIREKRAPRAGARNAKCCREVWLCRSFDLCPRSHYYDCEEKERKSTDSIRDNEQNCNHNWFERDGNANAIGRSMRTVFFYFVSFNFLSPKWQMNHGRRERNEKQKKTTIVNYCVQFWNALGCA